MSIRTRAWTGSDIDRAADMVTGYVDGLVKALREFGIEQEELNDVLLDVNVEQCPGCRWYVDSRDLMPDGADDPDEKCPNCRDSSDPSNEEQK